MSKDTLAIITILFLLKNRNTVNSTPLPSLSALQLESFIDNLHSAIHAIEKINNFSQSGMPSSLPDMKKILEVVEKIPL